jgi:hypothetical protein
MKRAVLRKTMQVDGNRQLHINVPADLGDEFEVIVFPVHPETGLSVLGDEEQFMLAAYSAAVPDNPEEDAIWERYIHA